MTKRVLKTLYVFSFLLILLFGGCQAESEPADIVTDFYAEFTSNYRDAEYSGNISANRQGVAYISISSPEELDGISFGYKNGELEMSRENLICSADEAYLLQKSFPSLVKSILDGVSQGRASLSSQSDSLCTYNLNTDSGNCVITTDKDGKITGADIKNAELKIEFSEVKAAEN
ncbi:MAG: hypothetical protein ACI4XI_10290 [Ruminococcus sp.]